MISLLWFLAAPSSGSSTNLFDVPEDFPTIQEAIDACDLFGKIRVASGTFTEQLTIDGKIIEITGAGTQDTIIVSPPGLTSTFSTHAPVRPIITALNGGDLALRLLSVNGNGYGGRNNQFVGVAFRNASGLLEYCKVHDVRDTPITDAVHGVGVFVFNDDGTDREVTVQDCNILDYQKSGLVFNGPNTVAHLSGTNVVGVGAMITNIQNGIQYAFGARGSVNDCLVRQNIFAAGGKTASGILIYNAGGVDVTKGLLANNQTGICYYNSGGRFIDSTVLTDQNAQGIMEDFTALSINGLGINGEPVILMPFGSDSRDTGKGKGLNHRITVVDSVFMAYNNEFGGGIRISLLDEQVLDVNIINSLISKWRYGIEVHGTEQAVPDVHLYSCRIRNNAVYGVANYSGQILTATYNEWGSENGPYHPTLNPGGLGDPVSDGVIFTPWYTGLETFKADHYHVFAPYGGPIKLNLDAGPVHAQRTYLILAGLSGSAPGTPLPGGHVILPLNWDYFTDLTMELLNSTIFVNFLGALDEDGKAEAQLVMPPLSGFNSGFPVYFAGCLCMPFDFVSNPMEILIVP